MAKNLYHNIICKNQVREELEDRNCLIRTGYAVQSISTIDGGTLDCLNINVILSLLGPKHVESLVCFSSF